MNGNNRRKVFDNVNVFNSAQNMHQQFYLRVRIQRKQVAYLLVADASTFVYNSAWVFCRNECVDLNRRLFEMPGFLRTPFSRNSH